MRRLFIILITSAFISWSLVSATIIHVPADYPTIQEGVDAAQNGDTVLVQPGEYVENINFDGHNIVLGSLFLMTGDTSYVSSTIIDGDESGTVVTFENGEDSTAILTGFTIQNGYRGIHCVDSRPTISNNIVTHNLSVGIYCRTSSNSTIINNTITQNSADGIYCSRSNPTISNNTISENSGGVGGGITCRNSSRPTITNNTISGNSARLGGGIHCHQSSPTISDNIIAENSSWDGGGGVWCALYSNPTITNNIINGNSSEVGGIYCSESSPTITNNTITGNSAYVSGGGIYCERVSNPIISNNVISANSASVLGGGIYCSESSPTITNNTITGNSAYVSGAGIYCKLVSNPVITNTIFWADSASFSHEIDFDDSSSPYFTYCDIQGGWGGEGNIDSDPLFRDPDNGDFHLMADSCGDLYNSPCIDTGDPAISDSMLGCDWGLGAERSDMGAYGGARIPTDVDEEQIPEMPMQFLLSQNYPNPFNATTTIVYNLSIASDVTIAIYDILGRKVKTLISATQPAGTHSVVWHAGPLSSGIYFYRIKAGEYFSTKRCIILK